MASDLKKRYDRFKSEETRTIMLSLLQTSLPRPVEFLWLIVNLPSPSSPRTGSGADSPILYCLEDNVPIRPSPCSHCSGPS